jgi:hypothetical protein
MSDLDHQIRSSPAIDPAAFREQGYTIVRQLLKPDEVTRLRATAREVIEQEPADLLRDLSREGTSLVGETDLLCNPSLRHVLLDRRLLRVVEELLGGKPLYFGDSSVRVGKGGIRGWHRDNVNRRRTWHRDDINRLRIGRGPDWHDEPYPLLRCGIYLQDQSGHSGGLALRPGSNRRGRLLPTLPKLVDAGAGDLIVWDLRTVHSGEVVRLRGLPDLPLHPRLQTRLPESLRIPDDGERIVLFMTFALEGSHLDYYLRYLKSRDYALKTWSASRFGPEVWAEAESAGLHVFAPVPEYGAPGPSM